MMITRRLFPILVTAALVLLGMGRPAQAQVRRPARAQESVLLEEFDEEFPPTRIAMDQINFDLRVFGRAGDVDAARKRVETILKGRVESLAYTEQLTEPQKKKLWVAGQGDIKRFFDSVQELRTKLPLVANDRESILEIMRETHRLARTYRSDLFSRGSIFAKTLSKTLTDEQSARLKKKVSERRQRQFRAALTWVAGTLEQTLKMTASQRRRLEKVLIEETRAPEAFGSYDYYGLIFQAAKVPEAKLKPIFDDDQWQALTRQFQEVKSMEKLLKDAGYLPVDQVEAESLTADDGATLEGPRIFPIGR
jgi:hypothetical protein